jgi:hypothetical protein
MMKLKMVVACLVGSIAISSIQTGFHTPLVIAKGVGERTASSVYKKANPAVVTIRIGEKSQNNVVGLCRPSFRLLIPLVSWNI